MNDGQDGGLVSQLRIVSQAHNHRFHSSFGLEGGLIQKRYWAY
jgi:hypothetical protein